MIELHGFADASKSANGAALYIMVIHDSFVTSDLEIAKRKVAPLKVMNIQRLELSVWVDFSKINTALFGKHTFKSAPNPSLDRLG